MRASKNASANLHAKPHLTAVLIVIQVSQPDGILKYTNIATQTYVGMVSSNAGRVLG